MKKISALILLLSFILMFTTACSLQTKKASMIQSKRRFAQYLTPTNAPKNGMIDLSEGPKQNYDAHLGPQNPNFDVRIVDPY